MSSGHKYWTYEDHRDITGLAQASWHVTMTGR